MLPLLKHNFSTNLPISDPYLYKLALPGVFEGGEEVSVLLDGVVGVEHVDLAPERSIEVDVATTKRWFPSVADVFHERKRDEG